MAASIRGTRGRMKQQFYKFLTHDFKSPIQGGDPVWDGKTLPFTLNGVTLDKSDNECAAGWNFVDSIETGFKFVGMWPTGCPSQILKVEPSKDKIQRGSKWRSSKLTITELATEDEIHSAIERFSELFVGYAKEMSVEQILWREALSRPSYDLNVVTDSLQQALSKRDLKWELKQFDAAWAALTVNFASLNKWITQPSDLLTTGIRDAYLNGLEIAIPVAKDTLGFAMKENTK